MSREEAEQGKAWVQSLVERLSRENGLEITSPFEWYFDMDHYAYWMDVELNGISKRWQFSSEKLQDCVNDKSVQTAIEKSLAQYFIPTGQAPNPTAETGPPSRRSADDQLTENKKTAQADDRKFIRSAIEEARKSVAEEDGRVHPKVGAVVVKDGRVLAVAHRGEFPGCHAEFVALEKKLVDVSVSGATVYTTLEPCTTRNHPKIPCASRLVERRVARVVIGMLDPNPAISGKGQRALRKARIATDLFPADSMDEVEELNREFTRAYEPEGGGPRHAIPLAADAGHKLEAPFANEPARTSLDKPFRWEEIDHSLVALKLADLSEGIRKEIDADEKRIRFDNRNNMNAATVPAQLLDMHKQRTDEWASRTLEIYREVAKVQGYAPGAAFLRSVYANAIARLIDIRTEAVASELQLFATRTNYPSQVLSGQLQGFRRKMQRLKEQWNRRLEAEAKEQEHTLRQQLEATRGSASEEPLKMQIQSAVFSREKNGFILIVEFRSTAPESEQLTEWALEFPSLSLALTGGPGAANLLPGAPWFDVPPFDIPARKITRGAVFFSGFPNFMGKLPVEPVTATLTAHLFPAADPLRQSVDIDYLKTQLRNHHKLTFNGTAIWPPMWKEKNSGKCLRGELGTLANVSKNPPQYEVPDHLVLQSEFDDKVWESELRADDHEFLASLYEKLRSASIGKSLGEVGDLEVP